MSKIFGKSDLFELVPANLLLLSLDNVYNSCLDQHDSTTKSIPKQATWGLDTPKPNPQITGTWGLGSDTKIGTLELR